MIDEVPDVISPVHNEDNQAEQLENESDCSAKLIIGIFCLKFALSQRAMAALLELLRLNLDVSTIKNVGDLLSVFGASRPTSYETCPNCHVNLEISDCCDDWYVESK